MPYRPLGVVRMEKFSVGSAARARAYRLFSQALEYEGELREQFLLRECGDDSALRVEIEALLRLAHHDEATTRVFLALPRREADLVGRSFGRFRLVVRIGQGVEEGRAWIAVEFVRGDRTDQG